jgi:hypothetical protein
VLSSNNLKLVIGLILFGLFILFSDLIPDFLVWLYHSLVELVHILLELLEETLDIIIEAFFDTGLHETQIIVFYIMLAIALLVLYQLIRTIPRWYRSIRRCIAANYLTQKNEILAAWRQLTLLGKVKWIALFIAGLYCLSLFIM